MSFELVGVKLVAEGGPDYFSTMAKADKAVLGFGNSSDKTFKQMPGLADIAVGALHKVGAIAVEVFAAAGKAVIGFISDSIGAAGDFESGMNKFSAVAGGALEESGLKLKDFRDQFIQIGKELPVSTAEVQDAAIEMVKGGIEPATIAAGGLKQVIQFAAAADLDLAQASTIAAKALGGWVSQTASAQEKADFLTHSTDLLAKAANASTVNVDDLALGLYNVQGTAKLAGVSFDETVTALAQLAPSFSSSADAGTSFKTFLARLQPSTKPAKEAMMDLGLWTKETGSAFYDAQGQFIGMEKAQQLLYEATKNLTPAQRELALQTIFGQDAIRTAAVFAEKGADGYNAMTASLEKQNSVAEMAKQKQAGFNTALDNFKGSVEALQITIGSVLLPVLTTLFNDYLAPGINVLTDLAGALSGDADAFGRLSPEMQAVSVALTQLWADIQTGYGFIQNLIASFQNTGAESSALGGVLNDLSMTWDTLMGVIETAGAAYQHIIEAVLPIVQDLIDEHGDEILDIMQEVWDTMIIIVNGALKIYKAIIPPVLEAIARFIKDNGAEISAIVSNVWTIIKATIDTVLAIIQGIIKATLAIIQGDFKGAHQILEQMNERVWNNIKEALGAAWDTIVILLTGVWNDIQKKASDAWETIKRSVETPINDLVSLFKSIPDLVSGVGEAIVQTIWDGIKSKWQEVVDWFNAKLEALRAQLPFSEPKDPSSPLRGLRKSGMALVGELQKGIALAPPLMAPSLVHAPASPMLMMARAAPVTNYNAPVGQRTTNLTYHTQVAPPVNHSMAIVNALAGGS